MEDTIKREITKVRGKQVGMLTKLEKDLGKWQ